MANQEKSKGKAARLKPDHASKSWFDYDEIIAQEGGRGGEGSIFRFHIDHDPYPDLKTDAQPYPNHCLGRDVYLGPNRPPGLGPTPREAADPLLPELRDLLAPRARDLRPPRHVLRSHTTQRKGNTPYERNRIWKTKTCFADV